MDFFFSFFTGDMIWEIDFVGITELHWCMKCIVWSMQYELFDVSQMKFGLEVELPDENWLLKIGHQPITGYQTISGFDLGYQTRTSKRLPDDN